MSRGRREPRASDTVIRQNWRFVQSSVNEITAIPEPGTKCEATSDGMIATTSPDSTKNIIASKVGATTRYLNIRRYVAWGLSASQPLIFS